MSDKIKVLEEKIERVEQTILSLEVSVSMMAGEINRVNEKVMVTENEYKELEDKTKVLDVTANGLQRQRNSQGQNQELKKIRTSNEPNIRGSFQFTDDELSIIYRAVFFESKNYEEVDANGYLGNATSTILSKIANYNKVIADPFYVSHHLSKAD
ncbi:hypothetical protein RYX56_05640 [Alkalihalophilus lindianensis]|uniref:Uncharacterized protein n=1 Tax=Alkalihalophilus lindianensis TaxID=1630542 RepID=A0ABU3X7I4_9BACI|nr:hypothetical protein [Alkalihalophilus lindianensis]MDV2683791.1 hypothetical protein [Alkalihalophilus lindianensis]MDV2683857.1 hypothetical protein [Alkalihalophilus lindianensis]